jgi:hypothetical protein
VGLDGNRGSLGGSEKPGWEWTGSARDSDHEMWAGGRNRSHRFDRTGIHRAKSARWGRVFIAQKVRDGAEFLPGYARPIRRSDREEKPARFSRNDGATWVVTCGDRMNLRF